MIALLGLVALTVGTLDMTQRRSEDTSPRIAVAGIFLVFSGLALLAEAWTNVGEFGLVGGVMLIFAGLAAAFGYTNEKGT